jgi:prolipoprotein diacylglyceryltransferase
MGRITKLPWGLQYFGEVRHETAMYSGIAGLILFIVLWVTRKRKSMQVRGLVTSIFMIVYGLSSFLIYHLRATDLPGSDPRIWIFTPSQYFAAGLFFIVIIILIRIIRNESKKQVLGLPERG